MHSSFRHSTILKYGLCYGLWLLGHLPAGAASPPVVTLQVSKPEVSVGEVFLVTVQLLHVPPGTGFRLQPAWKRLHIVSATDSTPASRTYQVMLLDTGEYTLEAQPVYLPSHARTDTLYTPRTAVWCRPLPVAQPDLHVPALEVMPYHWQSWKSYRGIVGAGMIVLLGWLLYRNRKKGRWRLFFRSSTATTATRQALKQLQAAALPDELFYKELTRIVHMYWHQLSQEKATEDKLLQGKMIQQKLNEKRFAPPVLPDADRETLYRQVWEWTG